MEPTNTLLAGARILDAVLVPLKFIFRCVAKGEVQEDLSPGASTRVVTADLNFTFAAAWDWFDITPRLGVFPTKATCENLESGSSASMQTFPLNRSMPSGAWLMT